MKKILFLSLTLFLFVIGISSVKAETKVCTNADFNKYKSEAANVKYNYESLKVNYGELEYEGDIADDIRTELRIYIYNVSDNLIINGINKTNGDSYSFTSDDVEDSTITIEITDISKVQKFEFEIVTKDQSCETQSLRDFDITLPKYNINSTMEICVNNPEFYLCSEFITSDKSFTEFYTELEEYVKKNEENKNNKDDENSTFKETLKVGLIVLGVAAVAGGGVAYYVISKRKRRII